MTDTNAPLTDEELSAILDGQADASVRERLASDPAGQARFDALRNARDLLAGEPVVPLSSTTVDSLVARAIAEGTGATHRTDDVVTPLAPRARRRSGPPMWAVAAVVAVMVAIGLGLVWSGVDDGSNGGGGELAGPSPTASQPTEGDRSSPDEDSERRDAAPSDTAEPTLQPNEGVPAPIIDLGTFDSTEDLRTALADSIPNTGQLADPDIAPSTASVNRCADQVATLMQSEVATSQPDRKAFARVDGQNVLAYEFALAEPADGYTSLISVVDPATCDPAFTFMR